MLNIPQDRQWSIYRFVEKVAAPFHYKTVTAHRAKMFSSYYPVNDSPKVGWNGGKEEKEIYYTYSTLCCMLCLFPYSVRGRVGLDGWVKKWLGVGERVSTGRFEGLRDKNCMEGGKKGLLVSLWWWCCWGVMEACWWSVALVTHTTCVLWPWPGW